MGKARRGKRGLEDPVYFRRAEAERMRREGEDESVAISSEVPTRVTTGSVWIDAGYTRAAFRWSDWEEVGYRTEVAERDPLRERAVALVEAHPGVRWVAERGGWRCSGCGSESSSDEVMRGVECRGG